MSAIRTAKTAEVQLHYHIFASAAAAKALEEISIEI